MNAQVNLRSLLNASKLRQACVNLNYKPETNRSHLKKNQTMFHIHWKKLGEAASIYNDKEAVYPIVPLSPNENWYSNTVSNPTPKAIVSFLTRWGRMRMSFDPVKIEKSIEAAKNALGTLSPYIFETVMLQQIRSEIVSAFQHILNGTRSPVAASKTLHVLRPRLFVMWDTAIRTAYGCGDYMEPSSLSLGDTYYVYLSRVQRCVKEALILYSKDRAIPSLDLATEKLKTELYKAGEKPLTKIVDEYNFLKYTKGREELWVDT